MSERDRVTSELLWRVTSITVPIDVVLLLLVARFVSAELFAKLMCHIAVAGVVYALLWGVLGSELFWDTVYSVVFPGSLRWIGEISFFPMLLKRLPDNSCDLPQQLAISLCIVGGIEARAQLELA